MTLVLTYHAVEDGPAPLCIPPPLFAEHAAVIAAAGVPVLTVSELAAALSAGEISPRAVAITFDDGCASVVEHAAPALAQHGLRATVFCVAGHLGGANDWRTQASWAPSLRLADAGALAGLAQAGWEIGSHGTEHEPLANADPNLAEREVAASRAMLEAAVGAPVRSFAWPYAASPSRAARAAIADTYEAACGGGTAVVRAGSDPLALPRVDAHYLRRPALLRWALARSPDAYLALRRAAGRIRRGVRSDYAEVA